MQHSGSLRYYASRLTLRYDCMAPHELDAAVEALQSRGRAVNLVLEPPEEEAFRQRFGPQSCRGDLDGRLLREWIGVRTVRFYDLGGCSAIKEKVEAAEKERPGR